jgi:glutamine cyclotransferase
MSPTWLKVALFTGLCLATSILHAENCCDAMSQLVRAITLCPPPNNPLTDGLQKLGGHLFQNVQVRRSSPFSSSVLVTADVIWSMHDLNTAIGAPSFQIGKIELETGYRRAGAGGTDELLYCMLKTSKTKDF